MFWWIFITVLLLLLCWLLFAPLELTIDTDQGTLSIRWISIASVSLLLRSEQWLIRLQIFFIRQQWDILDLVSRPIKKKKKKKRPEQKKKKSKQVHFSKIICILRSCRIKAFKLSLDTGDDVANAWLFPLNFFPQLHHHLFINFSNENCFLLKVRVTPWKMIWAFI